MVVEAKAMHSRGGRRKIDPVVGREVASAFDGADVDDQNRRGWIWLAAVIDFAKPHHVVQRNGGDDSVVRRLRTVGKVDLPVFGIDTGHRVSEMHGALRADVADEVVESVAGIVKNAVVAFVIDVPGCSLKYSLAIERTL